MPIALDMRGLYEQMLKELITIEARGGESMKEQAERLALLVSKQQAIAKLEAKLNAEKQFNRKVELNSQLKKLIAEVAQINQ